ncbi:MAG TPA: rhodanese-like domain-containing protein [Ilumatobacteraceae bacterium]|nr:rhodanese-like domain-containing protein [Ilumatobacteraceae bacterium]
MADGKTVSGISVQELAALGSAARVIDVREVHEWNDAHIEYAELIPLGTVPDRVAEFDGNPTYVICRSGGRSARACEFLAAQGREVVNVTGGMLAWVDAGLATVSGGASEPTGA